MLGQEQERARAQPRFHEQRTTPYVSEPSPRRPDHLCDLNEHRPVHFPASPDLSTYHQPQVRHQQLTTGAQQAAATKPVPHPNNSARCPPLNLEFLWKLYHQRDNLGHKGSTEERIQILQFQGFPTGLAMLILQHAIDHPLRIWLVDNCGTMNQNDGHVVSQSANGKVDVNDCTRWEEVTSTVQWHAELAAWNQTPMAVRLLQDPGIQVGPQQVGVSASKHYSSKEEVQRLRGLLKKTRPTGATSRIQDHVQELFPAIQHLIPVLEATVKQIVLCICIDSIPTNADGVEDPKMLQELLMILIELADWPVQIVLRLSTDEERVVRVYQNLTAHNQQLHDHLQVLDDYVSECSQVQIQNPWLHYGYPLHLCREEGIRINILEALSRRPLLATEMYDVVRLIFGEFVDPIAQYHSQQRDCTEFRKKVERWNKQAGVLWNPIKKKFVPWMDLKKIDKIYPLNKPGKKCTIM